MSGAVHVVARAEYWYPDDGGQVWTEGFQVVADDGRYVGRDDPWLEARGLHVAHLAGAVHNREALETAALSPGDPLDLVRDAGNPHDPNAIRVVAPGSTQQIGWVPRELAARVAPDTDAGRPWFALVLREQRRSPRDPRTGITMLLAPSPISLRVP